jgi:ABC-type uncharacterized transport system substrate-binding protein
MKIMREEPHWILCNDRLAGVCVGKILDGAQPADLPVHQATKIEVIVNLKTAKTLRR